QPFPRWDGKDFIKLPLLIKTKGKTTTDHISPAGPWLKYRGHLDKISDNMFLGATNAFHPEIGKGTDVLTGESGLTIAQIARRYKAKGLGSVVVGDENYGEGSSREHAAMSPRYLGVKVIITKSFARIHETNLKKQGILALTFADPKDYDRIEQQDRLSVMDLQTLKPGKPVTVIIHKGRRRVRRIAGYLPGRADYRRLSRTSDGATKTVGRSGRVGGACQDPGRQYHQTAQHQRLDPPTQSGHQGVTGAGLQAPRLSRGSQDRRRKGDQGAVRQAERERRKPGVT